MHESEEQGCLQEKNPSRKLGIILISESLTPMSQEKQFSHKIYDLISALFIISSITKRLIWNH